MKRIPIIIAALALAFSSLQSADAASTKSLTLNWKSEVFQTLGYPDKIFVPGKKVSTTFLNKEASEWCLFNYPLVNVSFHSASGKLLGTSSSKTTKKSVSIVSTNWQENEYGEDEFAWSFKCLGSFQIPVTTIKTKYYYLVVNGRLNVTPTKANPSKYRWFHPHSPRYTIEELNSVKWVVRLEFVIDGYDEWNSFSSGSHIWNPLGSNWNNEIDPSG